MVSLPVINGQEKARNQAKKSIKKQYITNQ